MPSIRNVRLPQRTKQALKATNASKKISEVMHMYAGNPEATFALILRRMTKCMQTDQTREQEKLVNTSITCDPNLNAELAKTAKMFEISADRLIYIAVEDAVWH